MPLQLTGTKVGTREMNNGLYIDQSALLLFSQY